MADNAEAELTFSKSSSKMLSCVSIFLAAARNPGIIVHGGCMSPRDFGHKRVSNTLASMSQAGM